MYRAVTLAVLRAGISPDDTEAVERLAATLHIELVRNREDGSLLTLLNGEDVSREIRSPEVTASVSAVSSYPGVRTPVVEQQRRMGEQGGVVMDGRDIGTVVFPDADVKVFMVADLNARAERRKAELDRVGEPASLGSMVTDLAERDRRDSSRDLSPLRQAEDAVLLDTSRTTIDEQIDRVLDLVECRLDADSSESDR